MNSILDKVNNLAQDRIFSLNKSDYVFQRVAFKNDKFVIYEIMSKARPIYRISEAEQDEEWRHSAVVRVTRLPDNEADIKALFDLFELRTSIKYEECPDLVVFYDQGLTKYGDEIYYLIRYDDPVRTFDHYINVDHRAVEIDPLDCFRLIRGALSAFAYLEENGYILTQFDDQNLYVGSFSEDRGCFYKIMFKGHKDKNAKVDSISKRYKFSAPETESRDIYKSYAFSAGLMTLYAIYTTHQAKSEFPDKLYEDTGLISEVIEKAASFVYKDEADKEAKEQFIAFFNDVLEPSIEKRKKPRALLGCLYIVQSDQTDYEQYLKEVENNERVRKSSQRFE